MKSVVPKLRHAGFLNELLVDAAAVVLDKDTIDPQNTPQISTLTVCGFGGGAVWYFSDLKLTQNVCETSRVLQHQQ